MIDIHGISGLVLAGGRGRRMQQAGQHAVEKALMRLHGRPLVSWAAGSMPDGLARLYISANRCFDDFAPYGTVVADDPALGDDLGPLAGVASVMRRMSTPWLYTAPADVPCPPATVLQTLMQQATAQNADLVYACTDRPQPLFMLVNKKLLDSLDAYLQAGSRQVQSWQREHGQAVHFSGDDDCFFNINTPDDLHIAHQRITTTGRNDA